MPKVWQSESLRKGSQRKKSQTDPLSGFVGWGNVKPSIHLPDWCDPVAATGGSQLTGINMLGTSPNPPEVTTLQ